MDNSYQQLNESLPHQYHKPFTLSQPVDLSLLSKETNIQQEESLEGWKMANQQRVSNPTSLETWRTSQQQHAFRQPKPLPNVPLQHRHSMPPIGDFYQNNLYYEQQQQQQQQQYHYSFQSPSMHSTADTYYEPIPNLVNDSYYSAYDSQQQQQQVYPYPQQENYVPYSVSLSSQFVSTPMASHVVYEEPESISLLSPQLPQSSPCLIPSSSTTTTTTMNTTPTSVTSTQPPTTTNDKPSSINTMPNNNNKNINTPKKKKFITSKSSSSSSPLDSREHIRQITVKSVNKEYRVWIDILPTETGISLANKIRQIATFGTRKIIKITTKQGRVIPLDARPIFGNWMDMSTFENGEFWKVEWCDLDKSMMDKFISKWLQVGNHSSFSTKKSRSSS
ncbi:unnamed protein product [Cunninghamella echinulata]